ncbi:MAG: hypothetical protein E6J34_22020 [Chloroflexi bacterium]|nr:MAG: hypothetical protein E6J34_22020 [Chloroflexota bacterium]
MPLRAVFEDPTIASFAQRVESTRRLGEEIQISPLVPMKRTKAIPISFAQRRLWLLHHLEPGSTTYLNTERFRLLGLLDIKVLEQCFWEMIRRHEILRTTFEMLEGQPIQVIRETCHCSLPLIDLTALGQQAQETVAQQLVKQEAEQPCNLEQGPLLRASLLRLQRQKHILLVTQHHIISDGWSNAVLLREMTTLYLAFTNGQTSPLAPLPIQYADYALWQRQWLQGKVLHKHLQYWQRQLQGASPLELPTNVQHSVTSRHQGAQYNFTLPTALSTALTSLSRKEGVTLFMTLLCAFQIWLSRLTHQTNIVIGTDVANRTQRETEQLIGFFVNLLVLRTDIGRDQCFQELLQKVRKSLLETYTYQGFPFELIVEHSLLTRKKVQDPIIPVLFVLQNMQEQAVQIPDLTWEILPPENIAARFDLALFLQEGPQGLSGSVVYRAALFERSNIATWMRQFEVLLSSIVARPDALIEELKISTNEEKEAKLAQQASRAKRLRTIKVKEFEID